MEAQLSLLSNGIVYSSGSNIHGQLGMDNTTTKCLHSFQKVPTHRTASNDCKLQIINICCGWQHSSALGKIVGHSSFLLHSCAHMGLKQIFPTWKEK